MKVFAASDYYKRFVRPLCKSSPDTVAGKSEVMRFPNGEMHAIVYEDVDGEDCLIIGSVAPPDEQLLALLTVASALKRGGAMSVNAFLPYLGYGRQDKFSEGESGGIALIGSLLKAAGVDEVITIDTHSDLDGHLIGLPLISLSPAQLFISVISQLGWDDITIVAPDQGAKGRAQKVASLIHTKFPLAYLVKQRTNGIFHFELVGKVSSRVVIVDDIIDSGRTLVSACNVLREHGVQEIIVAVTHGLFTNEAWKRMFGLGVKTIFVSDSCPEALAQNHPGVQVIPLAPLLPTILPAVIK